MSQPELIARLREANPAAPPELRERVRLVAAQAPPPQRRVTWRRAILVLAPVAAAAALAVAFIPRGGSPTVVDGQPYADTGLELQRCTGAPRSPAHSRAPRPPRLARPARRRCRAPSATRVQDYSATLSLRVRNAKAVSGATTQALRIVAALGGHPQTVRVNTSGKDGTAYLVLRVPVGRVQDAVRRLGALGTIVGENVTIQDLQAQASTRPTA